MSPNNIPVIIRKTRGSRALVKRSVSIAVIHVSLCRVSSPLEKSGYYVSNRMEERRKTCQNLTVRNGRGTPEAPNTAKERMKIMTCAAQDVVVLAVVPSRTVAAQPALRRQTYENVRGDSGG